jgi:hypothetical protein
LWVAGEYQARANIALSEAAAALRNALTGIRLQPTRATREISRDIGRVLDGQSLGDGIHDAPSALSRTVIGELLEDRFRIHSVERRNEVRGICRRSLVAGSTVQGDKAATLRISGTDLIERGLSPSKVGWDAKGRLWARRRAGVGGDAEATADRAPNIKRFTVLLVTAEDNKAEQG